MSHASLYHEDILLWSEEQAEIIRRLGRTRRDLPNELDIENVAEEIESVGRSELAAVKSHIRLILGHSLKLALEPETSAAGHWRGEIVVFHAALLDRCSPSMRQHIDMDELWRPVREQAKLVYGAVQRQAIEALPHRSPLVLDDVIAEEIDSFVLTAKLGEGLPDRDADRDDAERDE
jgi:hypothetical protein